MQQLETTKQVMSAPILEWPPSGQRPMVLALQGPAASTVRAVQQFLGAGAWDDAALLARREQLVAQDLGQPDGTSIDCG